MRQASHVFQGPFGRVAHLHMHRGLVSHAHPHCHILIKTGGADSAFRVGDRLCPLTDDTMVLVNAWQPHAYTPQACAAPTSILALYMDPQWLRDMGWVDGASGGPDFFPHPLARAGRAVQSDARALACSLSTDDPSAIGDRLDCLHQLVCDVVTGHGRTGRGAQSGCNDFRVRKALDRLKCSIGSTFTMEEIARESGLSRAQLFRGFQNTIGISPMLYFNALRIERAVRYLAEDDGNVSDIAEKLGFSMQAHFTRFFRGNIGMTPTQYRNAVRLYQNEPVH
ncbi:helix-turn-helix transcriptional regulator [Tepidamorphus sp. 3E244]|uniref:helix-turn-helix domain-containing protein n=1 Tax=Tepidamorphus sp. 3E244 TaxID=3385498 RepID=UPI0038FD08D3